MHSAPSPRHARAHACTAARASRPPSPTCSNRVPNGGRTHKALQQHDKASHRIAVAWWRYGMQVIKVQVAPRQPSTCRLGLGAPLHACLHHEPMPGTCSRLLLACTATCKLCMLLEADIPCPPSPPHTHTCSPRTNQPCKARSRPAARAEEPCPPAPEPPPPPAPHTQLAATAVPQPQHTWRPCVHALQLLAGRLAGQRRVAGSRRRPPSQPTRMCRPQCPGGRRGRPARWE